MKKKILSLCLALSLAGTLVADLHAEEWITEEPDTLVMQSQYEDSEAEDEILSESASSEINNESGPDITGTETLDSSEIEAEENETLQEDEASGQDISSEDLIEELEEVTEEAEEVTGWAEAEDGAVVLTETISGEVSHSGHAADASIPSVGTYRSGTFPGDYGSQLGAQARSAYDAMKAAWYTKRGYDSVPVQLKQTLTFTVEGSPTSTSKAESSGYQEALLTMHNAFQAAYDALSYDYPEIFWLDVIQWEYNISWVKTGNTSTGTITAVTVIPTYESNGAAGLIGKFDTAVNSAYASIASTLTSTSTREETVRAIHDWVCKRVYYNESKCDAAHSNCWREHNALGVFCYPSNGVVCEGYAKAVKILCRKFGLNCILVVGNTGLDHMWNYIQMENNNWYLLDATWDDGTTVSYKYFLIGSLVDNTQTMRILAPNFNKSAYSISFDYPVLNRVSYEDSATEHQHEWKLREEESPTCLLIGYRIYQCTSCGATSGDLLDQLHHSYKNNLYVYNRDGTKSFVCDYGCGTVLQNSDGENLTVKVMAQCNVTSLKLKKGQSTSKVKVTLESGDSVLSWKSSNTAIVKVSGKSNGTCKIKAQQKTGTATITVTLYSGLKKTIKVTVQKKAVTTSRITGVPSSLSMSVGQKYSLTSSVSPITSTQKLTYQSSNKKRATVSSKGVITAKKKGTVTITVKSGTKKVKCKITIK